MKRKLSAVLLLLIFLFASAPNLFADSKDTTPVPYTENEFPEWAKQLRRSEIITFGALPFVTIGVSLIYSLLLWQQSGNFINPLDKSQTYSTEQMWEIFGYSCGVSLAIGITDYVWNTIDLKKQQDEENRKNNNDYKIIVTPINEDEVLISREKSYENESNGSEDTGIDIEDK